MSSLALINFTLLLQGMLTIYANTDIAEAQAAFDSALNGIRRSNNTYLRIREQYERSRALTNDAGVTFEEGIREIEISMIAYQH